MRKRKRSTAFGRVVTIGASSSGAGNRDLSLPRWLLSKQQSFPKAIGVCDRIAAMQSRSPTWVRNGPKTSQSPRARRCAGGLGQDSASWGYSGQTAIFAPRPASDCQASRLNPYSSDQGRPSSRNPNPSRPIVWFVAVYRMLAFWANAPRSRQPYATSTKMTPSSRISFLSPTMSPPSFS